MFRVSNASTFFWSDRCVHDRLRSFTHVVSMIEMLESHPLGVVLWVCLGIDLALGDLVNELGWEPGRHDRREIREYLLKFPANS